MRKLCNANFGSVETVIRFAQWVNEIHHWGFGSWADGIVDDIKIVLRNILGARGVVSLTTDEIKEALRMIVTTTRMQTSEMAVGTSTYMTACSIYLY